MISYELFVKAGSAQNGNIIFHFIEPSPFMSFNVGHNIDLPNGQTVAIKEVHHQFASNPAQKIDGHRVILVV